MNTFLIKTPYFIILKLMFELVKVVSLRKICLKLFSLQKNWQKQSFCKEAASRGVLKIRVKKFHQTQGKMPVLESLF